MPPCSPEDTRGVLGSVDIYEQSNWLERFIEKIKPYIGTYPPNPPSCEEGGNCERFCEGY